MLKWISIVQNTRIYGAVSLQNYYLICVPIWHLEVTELHDESTNTKCEALRNNVSIYFESLRKVLIKVSALAPCWDNLGWIWSHSLTIEFTSSAFILQFRKTLKDEVLTRCKDVIRKSFRIFPNLFKIKELLTVLKNVSVWCLRKCLHIICLVLFQII